MVKKWIPEQKLFWEYSKNELEKSGLSPRTSALTIESSLISILRHAKLNTDDISEGHVYFSEAFIRQGVRLTLLRRFLPAGHNELQGRKKKKDLYSI